MNRNLAVLTGGSVAAAMVLGAGHLLLKNREATLVTLVAACEAESKEAQTKPALHGWENDPLVCDPSDLVAMKTPVGVQGEIAKTKKQTQLLANWPVLIASALFILGAAPALWYFLLGRVKELREALIGK